MKRCSGAGASIVDPVRAALRRDCDHLAQPVDVARDDVAAQLVARRLAARSRLTRSPAVQSPSVVLSRVSPDTSTANQPSALFDDGQAAARVADRGAEVDAGHVPGRLDLVAAVAGGLVRPTRTRPMSVTMPVNTSSEPSRSVPTGRHPGLSTARRRNLRRVAPAAPAPAPPTPGRPSPPSRIGARNHSIAIDQPARRKQAATCPPPSIISDLHAALGQAPPARPSIVGRPCASPCRPVSTSRRADRRSASRVVRIRVSRARPACANGGVRRRLSSTTRSGSAPRLAVRQAHRQVGIVGQHRLDADQDGVVRGAQAVTLLARLGR